MGHSDLPPLRETVLKPFPKTFWRAAWADVWEAQEASRATSRTPFERTHNGAVRTSFLAAARTLRPRTAFRREMLTGRPDNSKAAVPTAVRTASGKQDGDEICDLARLVTKIVKSCQKNKKYTPIYAQ